MEVSHYMLMIELIIERTWALVLWIFGVAFIIGVLLVGMELQLTRQSHHEDKIGQNIEANSKAAEAARVAAEKVDQDLQAAVQAGQQGAPQTQAAIEAIHRIEMRLCGGTCPEPPTTTTTTTTQGDR